MRYHRQLIVDHSPKDGRWGDCARTVLACLLDYENVEEVPHFAGIAGENEGEGLHLTDEWLSQKGYRRLTFAFDCKLDYLGKAMKVWNPGVPYCLIGRSPRGFNHIAIYRDGILIHDPHPSGAGISEPSDEGHYWVEIIASVPDGTAALEHG